MMNPMAMASSKLGKQRKYTPLRRSDSTEESARPPSIAGDLGSKKLRFGIDDDDQIEEMLSSNTLT